MSKYSLLILFFFGSVLAGWSQTRQSLEEERMRIIRQIDNISKVLEQTSQHKLEAEEELRLIQSQIEHRRMFIQNIRKSLHIMEQQIRQDQSKQQSLSQRYLVLKKDYDSLIRMSYRKLLTENPLVYLLSFADWDQSLQRLSYSRSLENYLRRQIFSLDETNLALKESIEAVKQQQKEQEQLLIQENENMARLEKDEKRKDDILFLIRGDEKRLRGALIRQQREREELNKAIESLILAGLQDPSVSQGVEGNSTGGFHTKQRTLAWPVEGGTIVGEYGRQKHPTLPNVFIENNGIDILSTENAMVSAIYDGEVAGVLQIPGNDWMVMLRHGHYFSVYSRLQDVSVTRGQSVSQGQVLGKLGKFNNKLHFEIWLEKEKLDPAAWLAPN